MSAVPPFEYKPYDNQNRGGAFFNYPLAYDAQAGVDQVVSPIAGGNTETLVVHRSAGRLNLVVEGSANATVTVYKGVTAQPGSLSIPPGTHVKIDTGGMNADPSGYFVDRFSIAAGADSDVSFWFDCVSPDGK